MEIQEVKDLTPISWQNQPVLVSKQVAKAYNTTVNCLNKNFTRAKEYFTEGVHYFKLTGDALRQFKSQVKKIHMAEIHPYAAWAYLWTYQGCARHCKMLNTPEAWQMFNELERVYFGVIKGEIPLEVAEVAPVEEKEVDTLTARIKKQIARPCSELAVVYALLMSNGTVKIGMTKDLTERMKNLKTETGLFVLNFRSTPFMAREDAEKLEAALLEKFSVYSMGGEFFDTKFSLVAAEL